MKAMQLQRPAPAEEAPLTAVDLPTPKPGPGQVRLKIHTCGVCHTDLHIVEGDLNLPPHPLIPGHEIIGVVDALGEGVTKHKLGDRLGVPWLNQTCGQCRYCKAGKENLCENIRFTGVHAPGGFAEYTIAHQDFAYPIPPIFSDEEAAPLMCAGVVGFRSLRLSEVKPGQRLGLYGFGASAHVIIQVARHWNCQVYVFTRSQAHREMALKMGAVWAGGAEDSPDQPMDSSIIFAPAGKLVPLALQQLDKGGVLALGGIYMSDIPVMPYRILWEERTIRSVANSTRQDVIDFLNVAAEIPIKTEIELYDLEDVNEVMLKMKRSQINGAAVLKVTGDE